MGFNPHTHEGCDTSPSIPSSYDGTVSIHTPTKGVTHTGFLYDNELCVSIHTPTKGVTQPKQKWVTARVFQSTHPRRV